MDTEEILITLVLAALIAGAIFFAARSQPADKSASASACPSDKSGKSSGKSGKSPGKSGKNSFQTIPDNYTTISQVSAALRKAGLESSELIVGIDFTKSNEWTGEQCFGGRSLHHIDPAGATLNPYQVAIRTVSHALEAFDDDGLIPAYGFGCSKTRTGLFSH
jgi:E3 ubiquitin-protein ligase RGLG